MTTDTAPYNYCRGSMVAARTVHAMINIAGEMLFFAGLIHLFQLDTNHCGFTTYEFLQIVNIPGLYLTYYI